MRVGITDYAQEQLGDIVYVSLPEVGEEVEAGAAVGELESTKSVSDVYVPVSGRVAARNEALDATPELVNSDPYGEGWLFELVPADAGDLDGLLDARPTTRARARLTVGSSLAPGRFPTINLDFCLKVFRPRRRSMVRPSHAQGGT